jgi:hypothetical protein
MESRISNLKSRISRPSCLGPVSLPFFHRQINGPFLVPLVTVCFAVICSSSSLPYTYAYLYLFLLQASSIAYTMSKQDRDLLVVVDIKVTL